QALWERMQATGSAAQRSIDTTVAAYEAAKTREYQAYWAFRNQQADPGTFDPNFRVTLSAGERATYTTFYTAEAGARNLSAADGATDVITLAAAHGYATGSAVVYHNGGNASLGLASGGTLVDGQTYYVIAVSGTQVKLAATAADADEGNALNLANQAALPTTHDHAHTRSRPGNDLTTYVANALTPLENSRTTQYRILHQTYGKLGDAFEAAYAYHANRTPADSAQANVTFGAADVSGTTIRLP